MEDQPPAAQDPEVTNSDMARPASAGPWTATVAQDPEVTNLDSATATPDVQAAPPTCYTSGEFIHAEPMDHATFYATYRPDDALGYASEDGYHLRTRDGLDVWMNKGEFKDHYTEITKEDLAFLSQG